MSRRGTPHTRAAASGTDLVHLAVPVEYLGHIARLIEELERRPRPLPPPPRRSRGGGGEQRTEWPLRELRRFAQGRSRTHQTVAAILDLLADRPGRWMPVGEIATALGSPVEKVIGALGGLTRVVKANHDYAAYGLPLQRSSQPSGRSTVAAPPCAAWS